MTRITHGSPRGGHFDVIIIGGGMAGISVASELSSHCKILLVEAETHHGYHSTGRSAAAFIASYGFENPALRLLTQMSLDTLRQPPEDLDEVGFLQPRGLITIAHPAAQDKLKHLCSDIKSALIDVEWIERDDILDHVPALKAEFTLGAIYEQNVFDIDVHRLQQAYLKRIKTHKGLSLTSSPVEAIHRASGLWSVELGSGVYRAPIIVNAAGAWADQVAALAGSPPVGVQAMRRTAILVDPPPTANHRNWPILMDCERGCYFKPDAGMLLASPGDESTCPPCDSAPDELDIAYAAHYTEETFDFKVPGIASAWSGLRTFAPDRTPVVGFSQGSDGFFWVAGQGGHGIQTAPAIARLAAGLILNDRAPSDLSDLGFDPAWVSPNRFH